MRSLRPLRPLWPSPSTRSTLSPQEGGGPVPFEFKPLEIPAVVLVEAKAFDDQRGFFMEAYKRSTFVDAGISEPFVQDNHSHSIRGVFRGLHYQNPPSAQGKLVQAI